MNTFLDRALDHAGRLGGRALLLVAAGCGAAWAPASAQTINFAQTPLFLGTTVKPNVLVVLDNSESMDGTMSGMLIAGSDPSTRGNIARSVLRSNITAYRSMFQWGLASFALSGNTLYNTYAYYFGGDGANGSNADVVYTNDCVNGISATNHGLRCVPNPQTGNGYGYITYAVSGDDAAINDVLYTDVSGGQYYGIGVSSSTNYNVWSSHGNNSSWTSSSFSSSQGTWGFTPTDAGFLPGTYAGTSNYYPRIFWLPRAWGYYANITGAGVVNEAVMADSTTHYNNLMALLAAETNTSTGELKNGAVFTPLAGTLGTAKSYFASTLSGKTTPISQTCQKNFVLLATDGNPTGTTSGNMYSLAQQANIYNSSTGSWTFGTAQNDVFNAVTALRSTSYNGNSYDVQTYVIGLGSTVSNPSSIATLNKMAALGGTGSAYLATDQNSLTSAFATISVDIVSRTAAASAVTMNAGSWNSGAEVFQGRFSSSDWSGQLLAFAIGNTGATSGVPLWDAGQQTNALNWNTGRQIITYKPSAALGSRGVPFRWPANAAAPGAAEIDPGMVTALNTSSTGTVDNYGSQRLQFLRGNTALEARNCSSCAAPVFRSRPVSVLGDIVNSAPSYVSGPTDTYRDTLQSARYSSYATTRSALTPVIYVGANDGMLHAFNAGSGSELFAYVPWAVAGRLSALTSNPYVHEFTVDGSPSVGDVFYGGAWHTLLVAGMSAGAPGLYALDVTNPANFSEANAAQLARWEIGSSDADVGYIFSRPILTKNRDGRWRAIVGNGYNSANGHAVLLLVDLETGAVTRIDTGRGAAGTPNGLSAVAVISTRNDGVADAVYAGDLYGNLWKFDLSASSAASWKVAYGTAAAPLPLFTTASGQPITARPDITPFPQGGYLIALGTGRYLDVTDNASTGSQALYGIWDNGAPVAMANLQTQTVVTTGTGADGNTYRLSTHAVGPATDAVLTGDNAISLASYYATRQGWKLNLPSSGERVVADVAIRNGRVVVSTVIPNSVVCSFGGSGWVMDLDMVTGNRTAALDTNADNVINASDYIAGDMASGVMVNAVPAAATVMRGSGSQRQLEFKMINTSNGSIVRVPEAGNPTTSRRAAWEQLQ